MSRRPTPPRPEVGQRPPAPAPARRPETAEAGRTGSTALRETAAAPACPGGRPGTPPGVVSLDSVRGSARTRMWRPPGWRPLLVLVAVAALGAGVVWAVLGPSLLVVRDVAVVGLDRIEPAQVLALAEGHRGEPLATVDTGTLESRVQELTLVSSAQVLRVWPSTLEVRVVERTPVAAVPVPGGVRLVDADGVAIEEQPRPPDDLPVVEVDVDRAGPATLQATLRVLESLPPELMAQVESVGATSPDSVRMRLRPGSSSAGAEAAGTQEPPAGEDPAGAEVLWGDAEDNALKAQVLQVLQANLTEPVQAYDVSAPLTPVTR